MPYPEEAQRKGGQKGRKHGIYSLQDRGPEALKPAERSRYQELRELVKSQPGREEFREELLSTTMLIVEMGVSELRHTNDLGQSIWTVPVIKALASYINSAARLIDSFPKDDARNARMIKVVEEMKERAEAMEAREAEKPQAPQKDTPTPQDAARQAMEPTAEQLEES